MAGGEKTGASLEALVRKSATHLEREGLRLSQTSPRFVGRVGPKGKARGRVVSKGDLDFVGDYRGRSVSFDAKSTKCATRLDLKLLKGGQVNICKYAHARGSLAFFLLEFSQLDGGPRYFALTWPTLKPFWDAFRTYGEPASIPLATIVVECLEVRRVGAVLDLVGVVREMLEVAA